MNLIKSISLSIAIGCVGTVFYLQDTLIPSIHIQTKKQIAELTIKKVKHAKIPEKLLPEFVDAIEVVSEKKKIDKDILIALPPGESGWNKYAVSCKGYHGLYQIPYKIYDVYGNMFAAADIYNEKLRLRKGNVSEAIFLYKGYPLGSSRGKEQVQKVMTLYRQLKEVRT